MMSKQLKIIILIFPILIYIFYEPLYKVLLQNIYQSYSPTQIVREYHKVYAMRDIPVIKFLSYSKTLQYNIIDLSNSGTLLYMWTDSVITSRAGVQVYSTFKYKYNTCNIFGEPITEVICVRIQEDLYIKDDVWRIGLGNVIDIGYLYRLKNINYINIKV